LIRVFAEADEPRLAEIWHCAGLDEYTYLPAFQALDRDQALQVFRDVIASKCRIWLESSEQTIRGFIALDGSYVDRLYVDPAHQRRGVGVALMNHAKGLFPSGLELHTHQQNGRARAFYEKHDFGAVKFGVSPAPESVRDVEYHWRP
jgi:ribosomal protein S18 acetylase RimI-like enzyme